MVAHLTSVHGKRVVGTLYSVTADLITNPEIPKQCVNQDGEATTEQSLPYTADIREQSADRKAGPRQHPVRPSNRNTVRIRSSNRQINITKTFNQETINQMKQEARINNLMKVQKVTITKNVNKSLTLSDRFKLKQVPRQEKCNFVAKPCEGKADLWKNLSHTIRNSLHVCKLTNW